MKIDKDYFMRFIDIIYKYERIFLNMSNTYKSNMKKINYMSDDVDKLVVDFPKEGKIQRIITQIKELSQELLAYNNYIKTIQSGNISLFNWTFLDETKLSDLSLNINNTELVNWLDSKLIMNQKIIYSEISIKPHENKSNSENKYIDLVQNLSSKFNEFLDDKEKVYVFLLSPYDVVGKEIAKIYLSFKKEVFIEQFSSRDLISYSLTKNEEKFDQDILLNLIENNSLSNLYKIAKENAATSNDINFLSLERELSEIFLEKNLNKDEN